jgi:hypothetical protein
MTMVKANSSGNEENERHRALLFVECYILPYTTLFWVTPPQ